MNDLKGVAADIRTRTDREAKIRQLKQWIKKEKPTYSRAIAYSLVVLEWSVRNARETMKGLIDGRVLAVPLDKKGNPVRNGVVKVIDGDFVVSKKLLGAVK